MKLFCRQIDLQNKESLAQEGPLLIVANHPNAFLDAIIIAAHCRGKVHFLARGDIFSKSWQSWLLKKLNMVPVYSLSEEKKNKCLNEQSFKRATEILSGKGILLVFIEGITMNRQELQPFKKGAARIAHQCVEEKISLSVLPIIIQYSSLNDGPGKNIMLRAGEPMQTQSLFPFPTDNGKNLPHFNYQLFNTMSSLLNEQKEKRDNAKGFFSKTMGVLGWLLHIIPYTILQKTIRYTTRGSVFYDSVLFTSILLLYPLYLLALAFFLYRSGLPLLICMMMILLHPISAWFAIQCLPYSTKK